MADTVEVRDIVCGMTVDPKTAQWKSEYQDKTYYFCAPGCKRAFDQDPEQYVGQQGQAPTGMQP